MSDISSIYNTSQSCKSFIIDDTLNFLKAPGQPFETLFIYSSRPSPLPPVYNSLVGLDEKMDKRKSHIIKYFYPAANVSFLFCHLILPLLHNLAKCKSSKMIPGYSLFFQPEFPSISLFLVKLMSVEKLRDM